MLTKIDELNRPEYEAISYDEYFAPMDIPEEDKEKRVEMAEEIDDIYYDFFAMIATMVATQQYLDWDYLNDYLNTRLYDTFENYEYSATRDYLQRYADLTASNTVTTTLDHQGEEYYLSDERASRLAAENAQTIANYTELQDAILAGFTHKTWKAELTKATRKDHREMNGHTIRIEKYFKFPDCEMIMPHDEINGTARQNANCRCSLGFSTQENASDITDSQKESGAVSGAILGKDDPDGTKRAAIAEDRYTEIRNRKPEYEIRAVAEHSGFTYEEIERVYNHIFIREHLLDSGIGRFAPDYYMAHSWTRLREGKIIYPHDITMIKHELIEEKIMGESLEIPARKAHNIADKQFSYEKELLEYLKSHGA